MPLFGRGGAFPRAGNAGTDVGRKGASSGSPASSNRGLGGQPQPPRGSPPPSGPRGGGGGGDGPEEAEKYIAGCRHAMSQIHELLSMGAPPDPGLVSILDTLLEEAQAEQDKAQRAGEACVMAGRTDLLDQISQIAEQLKDLRARSDSWKGGGGGGENEDERMARELAAQFAEEERAAGGGGSAGPAGMPGEAWGGWAGDPSGMPEMPKPGSEKKKDKKDKKEKKTKKHVGGDAFSSPDAFSAAPGIEEPPMSTGAFGGGFGGGGDDLGPDSGFSHPDFRADAAGGVHAAPAWGSADKDAPAWGAGASSGFGGGGFGGGFDAPPPESSAGGWGAQGANDWGSTPAAGAGIGEAWGATAPASSGGGFAEGGFGSSSPFDGPSPTGLDMPYLGDDPPHHDGQRDGHHRDAHHDMHHHAADASPPSWTGSASHHRSPPSYERGSFGDSQRATMQLQYDYDKILHDMDGFKACFAREAARACGIPPDRIRIHGVRRA
eukprot:TRINITY_DN17987_c0_g1_i1.p1 TRINITY_DN17987_c0_g1~~TRINITY_DN17987_c0_g1_i1.p1  ORF type:complete len:493 (+),score=85.79 TRINITY_DN17987_c0_g1_i1:63-1541(+)